MSVPPLLSIVVVSYRVPEVLAGCLASLAAHPPSAGWEAIVVDNASGDGTAEMVRRDFPWAHVIANPVNRGFAAANDIGVRSSSGRYVLFLNNDARVLPATLDTLLDVMEKDPSIGALGGRLVGQDGRLQQSRGWYASIPVEAFQRTLSRLYRRGFPPAVRYVERLHRGFTDVEWLDGACILARREALEMAGGFDTGFFMYFEDIDLCLRIRRAGWRISFTPSATVVHLAGRSGTRIRRRVTLEYRASQLRFYRKHRYPVEFLLLKAYLAAKFSLAVARDSVFPGSGRGFRRRFALLMLKRIARYR